MKYTFCIVAATLILLGMGAPAAAGVASARSTTLTAIRMKADGRCQFCKPTPRYQADPDVVKSDYSEPR